MATVDDWAHEVGVTTSSFGNQITADAATSAIHNLTDLTDITLGL